MNIYEYECRTPRRLDHAVPREARAAIDGLGSAKFLNDMWCANPWHNWQWQWNEFEGVPLTLYEQGNWRRDLSKLEEQPVNNFFEYTDEKAEASHAPSADDLVV